MSINYIFTLSFFNMMSVRAGRVLIALYALQLGAQSFAVGMLAATFSVFPGVLSWPIGILTDRIGSRWPLMFGTAGLAFAALAPYFFPGMPALFVASAVIGLSFAFFNVTTQNLIGLLGKNEDHARNFSNFSLVQSVASFVGPLLVGFGIDHAGFGFTCLYLALLSVLPIMILVARGGALPGGTGKVKRRRERVAHAERSRHVARAGNRQPGGHRHRAVSILYAGLRAFDRPVGISDRFHSFDVFRGGVCGAAGDGDAAGAAEPGKMLAYRFVSPRSAWYCFRIFRASRCSR